MEETNLWSENLSLCWKERGKEEKGKEGGIMKGKGRRRDRLKKGGMNRGWEKVKEEKDKDE